MPASNGRRRPRRPRIELVTPAASDAEAAAISVAIERFLADAPPAPRTPPRHGSGWQRAAIRDAVEARAGLGPTWGSPEPWERAARADSG